LLKRLIGFVAAPPSGQVPKLTLQDIALCRLWAETQSRRSPLDEAGESVVRAVASWIARPDSPDLATAGRRHQLLLRELVNLLNAQRADVLTVEETAFLTTVLSIAHELGENPVAARAAELLEPHAATLAAHGSSREPAPGLVTLERRIHYATERDILAAEVSPIRLLAGIELPCRGPVFKISGNVRILGDVPEGSTVVVENDGSCCVDGYVMGRVLSRRQCEVRHNISGVVIVLTGHIRARGIINNATAISKLGNVFCINAQGPRLVFAGQSIDVAENVLMGRYITRNMRVGGEVRGGRLEISGEATAGHFRHLGMSNVSVVLRRELSCSDFGEVTGAELNQLLSRAYGLRRQARNFSHLALAARREADHMAQSVLMFIFGGGEVQKRLEGLLRAQRRHAFISHVVLNLGNMLIDAREGHFQTSGGEDEAMAAAPPPAIVNDEGNEADDEDLKAAQAEAATLEQSLRSRALDRGQTSLLLETARQKLAAMTLIQARMAEQVALEERAMQNLEKYEQILAGSGKNATKLEVLNRILPALQKQPPDSPIGKRLRSSFVVRALRTIERGGRHAAEFDAKATEHLTNFRAVSERLGKDFQIRILENPEEGGNVARVTGRFESGARIYMDDYIENLAEAPPDAVVITPHDDAVRTYLRSGAGTRFHSAD